MSVSIKAKFVLASLMQAVGFVSWKLGRYPSDAVAVLMYHRVIPREMTSAAVQAGMVVEPETLDLHLRYLRRYFKLVPLAKLASMREDAAQDRPGKPLCVLTFDDGWHDFYEYAYPVLKLHGAPATVFLPTDFIGTRRWFWTDRLGFLFSRMDERGIGHEGLSRGSDSLLGRVLAVSGGREKRLEHAIALLKPHMIEEIESVVVQLAEALGEDDTPTDRSFLSWDEVREMFDSGLVSFGSHTAAHLLLTTVPEAQARFELRKSMDALIARGVVDRNCVTFCYPNGNFSDRLCELVQEEGYSLATTTQRGWHHRGENPFAIRRISVHQDIASTESLFGVRVAGIW